MSTPTPFLTLDLADEAAMVAFAEDTALALAPGDVVALSGGLGAGKTTFARALIRALADDQTLEVPSPTFTLVQTYATGRLSVAHFDLYRVGAPAELDEVGLEDAGAEGAVLIEWPERAGDRLPPGALTIAFAIAGTGRRATVTGAGGLAGRLSRSRAIRGFLDRSGWSSARRRTLAGDASRRIYERVHRDMQTAVLMDWPADGMLPPDDVRARFRARNVQTFQAVDEALRQLGLSAPEIYAADLKSGFLLLEDLGDEGLAPREVPDPERYSVAAAALALIHSASRPRNLGAHRLLPLGLAALAAEVRLFLRSYVPFVAARPLSAAAERELAGIWSSLFAELAKTEQSWVLFDVQSPNLFWLPERSGVARVGFIDFQDMFFGPSAYDVASLCQDARISIPPSLEMRLRGGYVAARRAANPAFDEAAFERAYAISAAVRTCKNLGLFARFAADGRPEYLRHMERLRAYLSSTLASPVLSPLRLWYEETLPR